MSAPPLAELTIVVTRAASQATGLAAQLIALGAKVEELPTIAIAPPADPAQVDHAIQRLGEYHWMIFTSVNGVDGLTDRMEMTRRKPANYDLPVCAIGPATAARARERGWRVELVPEQYVAESLVAAFSDVNLAGRRILLPRAAVARDVVPAELAKRGATVDVVEVYRTVAPEGLSKRIRALFGGPYKPDWITFTSSSTVRNFAAAADPGALEGVRVASIGPVTTATARELGIPVTVEADPYTLEGLIAALVQAVGGLPKT